MLNHESWLHYLIKLSPFGATTYTPSEGDSVTVITLAYNRRLKGVVKQEVGTNLIPTGATAEIIEEDGQLKTVRDFRPRGIHQPGAVVKDADGTLHRLDDKHPLVVLAIGIFKFLSHR